MGFESGATQQESEPVSDSGGRIASDRGRDLTARSSILRSASSPTFKLLTIVALFALFIGPTFISYTPYEFQWDDADYLARSVTVSRAFWSWNEKAVLDGMVSIRPPMMTLLGVPWGSLATWNAAGNCFITLAALTACMAALCLYLLLRIGVKPLYLILASIGVFASIGPFPPTAIAHIYATGFLNDSLLAWTALAAVLLIPYEMSTPSRDLRDALLRGILWGVIFSLGTMTKLSFLYFVVLIIPILLLIIRISSGLLNAFAALIGVACSSAPSAFYLLRWGRLAYWNAKASSFGGVANFYYVPLRQFFGETFHESPGMLLSLLCTTAALIYSLIKRRSLQKWPEFLALLIVLGFGVVVFSAPNRQIRYAFAVIVALPFLAGILMSAKDHAMSAKSARIAAVLAFCILLVAAIPMRHRPDRQRLGRAEAVLAVASRCNVSVVHLATDSPTLNGELVTLARKFSPTELLTSDTLAYRAMSDTPIEDDFRVMNKFTGLVIFQDREALFPPFTNVRVAEYERYAQQVGLGPIKVAEDTTAYLMRSSKGMPTGCAQGLVAHASTR